MIDRESCHTASDLVPGGGRTLDQLKREVLRRVEHNLPPLGGIGIGDARAALAAIDSLSREQWALAWNAVAEQHFTRAASLEASAPERARELHWQAWRLNHFARWPVENSPAKQLAKNRALEAFRCYGRLLEPALEVVRIPFEGRQIIAYLRLPAGLRPAPLVFAIAGLDSRKEDFAAHADQYLQRGVGLLTVDLPGTGESPLAAAPDSDCMFSALLDYLATRPDVDAARIVVQGRSWSGYWAAKLAHTERVRLRGSVMHGGPIHHYFQPDWLRASLATDEYLYDYLPAKEKLFGADGLDDLLARAQRYSLLDSGILDQPCAPMLLVNGARDTQIPIADLYLLLEHGDAKEAWVNPQGGHMGRSPQWPANAIFERVVMPWIARRLEL